MKFFNSQSDKVKIFLIVLLFVFICCCGINSMAFVGSFLPSTPTKEIAPTRLVVQTSTNLPTPTLEATSTPSETPLESCFIKTSSLEFDQWVTYIGIAGVNANKVCQKFIDNTDASVLKSEMVSDMPNDTTCYYSGYGVSIRVFSQIPEMAQAVCNGMNND